MAVCCLALLSAALLLGFSSQLVLAEECELSNDVLGTLNRLERQQRQILLRLGMAPGENGVLSSCSDASTSGVYRVRIGDTDSRVYCKLVNYKMWMVIQRRNDGRTNFSRSWTQYQEGFGRPEGEFWLGNELIYKLTSMSNMRLRVELTTNMEETAFTEYDSFWVKGSSEHYALHVGGARGPAGDGLGSNNGESFSARDQHHDGWGRAYWCDSSPKDNGAWWNKRCTKANLNGRYGSRSHNGMFWSPFVEIQYNSHHHDYRHIVKSEMMIRQE